MIAKKTYQGKPQVQSGIKRDKSEQQVFDRLYTNAELQLQHKLQKQKEQEIAHS